MKERACSTVAIIGGGIAGMHAALLLAEAGRRVALIERGPGIGGSLHLLERTFPTDSCGLCFMEPQPAPTYCPTFVCAQHPLITLYPLASVTQVEGEAGDFRLTLRQAPRYVRLEACDGCGICETVCPVERAVPEEGRLQPVSAIRRAPPRAVPGGYFIDVDLCLECGICADVCPRGAIDLDAQPKLIRLGAAAVIAAPGYSAFPARYQDEYGYGVLNNVMTSLEFECLLNSAPAGRLLRPTDGREIQKIAFISCVGSRDPRGGRPYCSAVCCAITAKQAVAARERDQRIESCVFYMDLRAGGAASGLYLERQTRAPDVRYERCQVSTIKQRHQSRNLLISYQDAAGRPREEEFDLVVLAVGLGGPSAAQDALARGLGIEVDMHGLGRTLQPWSLESTRPGVLLAGAFREPKDIAETVVEAGAAAAMAAAGAPALPEAEEPAAELPPAPDELPRVGVFLCADPASAPADAFARLVERMSRLPGVATVRCVPPLHSAQGQETLARACAEAGANRLVIVGSALTRNAAFEQGAARALALLGLPDAALAVVDSDAGRSAPHPDAPLLSAIATEVAGLRRRPATPRPMLARSSAGESGVLVLGGGAAGLSAALTLVKLGCRVELWEREGRLGGRAAGDERLAAWLEQRMAQVEREPRLALRLGVAPQRIRREGDGFVAEMDGNVGSAGAIIVATGARPALVRAYGYGDLPGVLTQDELEAALRADGRALAGCRSVAMIQCAGRRDESPASCSRTCCVQAVRNALRLKELQPGLAVSVLFREMQTPGMHELEYERARAAGVLFIRHAPAERPAVRAAADGSLRVSIRDALLCRPLELRADRVILSAGVEPAPADWMAGLGLTFTPAGYLQPAHAKLRPLHTTTAGVFACGAALGPCFADEAILQGHAAALAAALYLRRQGQRRPASASLSRVRERLCSGCGLCVSACPFEARVLGAEDHIAHVDEQLCAGCGICAMACPNGATQQRLFETEAMLAMVDAALG